MTVVRALAESGGRPITLSVRFGAMSGGLLGRGDAFIRLIGGCSVTKPSAKDVSHGGNTLKCTSFCVPCQPVLLGQLVDNYVNDIIPGSVTDSAEI